MDKTLESVKEYLEENYDEETLVSSVDEAMYDFLDDDWEEEYSDAYEAYAETGRGEAESQVTTSIQDDILGKLEMDYWDFERKFEQTISAVIFEIYEFLDKD
jgi:hypothetical protein